MRQPRITYGEHRLGESYLDFEAEWTREYGLKKWGNWLRKADPAEEDIRFILERMKVEKGAQFTVDFVGEPSHNLMVASTEKNRVFIRFVQPDGRWFFLYDLSLLDSDKLVELYDPYQDPYPIAKTVKKETALKVVMHYIQTSDIPRDREWRPK